MAATITVEDTKSMHGWMVSGGKGNLGVYATGGIAVAANDFRLGTVDLLDVFSAGGYTFEYDKTNKKVKAYSTAATEVANATDLTAVEFRFLAYGA